MAVALRAPTASEVPVCPLSGELGYRPDVQGTVSCRTSGGFSPPLEFLDIVLKSGGGTLHQPLQQ